MQEEEEENERETLDDEEAQKNKKHKNDRPKHKVNVIGTGDYRVTGLTSARYEEILSDPRIRFIYMVDNLLRAVSLRLLTPDHERLAFSFVSDFAKADDHVKVKDLDKYKNNIDFKTLCAYVGSKARERDHFNSPFNTCNLMRNEKAWDVYRRIALCGSLKFFILAHDRLLKDIVSDQRTYVDTFSNSCTPAEPQFPGVVGTFADIKLYRGHIRGPLKILNESSTAAASILVGIHPYVTFVFGPRELLYINCPIILTALRSNNGHPSLSFDNSMKSYKDHTCKIGENYYITRRGLDDDTVTTSFLNKNLEVHYLPNVPRVDFKISNGKAVIQKGNITVEASIVGDFDISFTAYVSKRIVRVAKVHSFGKSNSDFYNCYKNFVRGLKEFVIKNFDITTPTSKPPGFAERHKGYIICNNNTKEVFYSTYYLHYRATQHRAVYNYCFDNKIVWPFDVPDSGDKEHGDLVDYIFDNRYKPPKLLYCRIISKYEERKERRDIDPYRAADRDFFPSQFEDIINTYRNAFMLDDIIHFGQLETEDPNASLKYGTDRRFPYAKDKDPLGAYLEDYYSTIQYDEKGKSSIDSVNLGPPVVISGNRDFDEKLFKENQDLMEKFVHEDDRDCDPDSDIIMTARMYNALINYDRRLMAKTGVDRMDTI